MPQPNPLIAPPGAGTTLIRLQDITLDQRLQAMNHIIRHDNLTIDEALELLDITLDPGDASGRIA